jgi:hypothetical protein
MLLNGKMLVVVIIFILTFALIGGVVYFSTKKNEEPPISDSGGSLVPAPAPAPAPAPVPIKRDSQATKKAKKMEPKPAPVPKKKPDPIDCVGSWSPWTDCTAKCNQDDGVRQRVFTVLRKAEHGGSPCSAGDKEKEMDACKASKGHYRNTGGCSKSCGSGEQRQDFVLTTRGHDQGSSCPPATKFVKCNTHRCPVNCSGRWVSKSEGAGRCGRYGSKAKIRTWQEYQITRNAAHGGAGCPAGNGQRRGVNEKCI